MKILKKLVSIIITIVFFMFLFTGTFVIFVKYVTSEKTIYNTIKSVDIYSLKTEEILNKKSGSGKKVKDVIEDKFNELKISTTYIDEAIDDTNKYIAKTTHDFIKYLLYQTDTFYIDKKDLYENYKIKNNTIYQRTFTDEQMSQIDSFVDSTIKTVNDSLIDRSEIISNTRILQIFNKLVCTENIEIYFIVGLILIYLILSLINSFSLSLKPVSISFKINGIIFIICTLSYYFIKIVLKNSFLNSNGVVEQTFTKIFSKVFMYIAIIGLISLIIGICFSVIYKITKKNSQS